MGRYNPNHTSPSAPILNLAPSSSPDSMLQRFWEMEEVPGQATCLSHEEALVVKQFDETHVHSAGRYKVTLPRRSNAPLLGNSRVHAIQRFYSNERSISRRGQWEAFQSVIQEYLDMSHAEPVPTTSPPLPAGSTYYLPMHSVVKETSSTTKLRVVFDASAKTTSGASLNDCLMVGPTLFPNITDILLRFSIYLQM